MTDKEQILSLKYQLENEILKSDLVDDFKDVKIQKTGKELKEKLQQNKLLRDVKKKTLLMDLENVSNKIGILPRGKVDSWQFRGFKDVIQFVPFKYSYTQINEAGNSSETNNTIGDPEESYNESCPRSMMYYYNKKCYEYIEESIDCLMISTIISNIEDNKKYSFSPETIAKLDL